MNINCVFVLFNIYKTFFNAGPSKSLLKDCVLLRLCAVNCLLPPYIWQYQELIPKVVIPQDWEKVELKR